MDLKTLILEAWVPMHHEIYTDARGYPMDAFDPIPVGILDRERIVAKRGFNRWLVPPRRWRSLTAWSAAGIFGPLVVNYIRDAQIAAGVPRDRVYDRTMYILAGFLVVGGVLNLLIKPLAKTWFMSDAQVAELQAKTKGPATTGGQGIGLGGLSGKVVLAWLAVGIPLAWGVWVTITKALVLFG